MRGEYSLRIPGSSPCTELPPRARRIQLWQRGPRINGGTTSACAENTGNPAGKKTLSRNYLRVRGEYICLLSPRGTIWELPPRARRILHFAYLFGGVYGTTSACAENTANRVSSNGIGGNYLRVRGEYQPRAVYQPGLCELPPRARRIPIARSADGAPRGTTSACAENTR